tara:strand:- start:804 stop:1892 length:1089 start_codon:yes stop_codon:yes gene_type:complete
METKSISLKELAKKLKLKFSGNGDFQITHTCGLDSLGEGGLAYLTNPNNLKNVQVPAGITKNFKPNLSGINFDYFAFIVPPENNFLKQNIIISTDPLASHVEATNIIHLKKNSIPDITNKIKIHPSAFIGKKVKMGKNVIVGPKVVIYEGVKIGANTIIHSGTVIMSDTTIGMDCLFFPNVVIQDRTKIGDRVIIQSGAIIGSDGHGFLQREGINKKIPQVGNVIIEDDVEVGACSTVDRARFKTTIIKRGCKIDNQVQIAHNVSLGEQALISAQSAIGGSVKAGPNLIMGGQSGIRDNVEIGEQVRIIARGVVTSNTKDNEILGGMPGRPINQWRKIQSLINRLTELFDRVRKLESQKNSK